MAQNMQPIQQGMSRAEWTRLADSYEANMKKVDRQSDVAAWEKALKWARMQAANASH